MVLEGYNLQPLYFNQTFINTQRKVPINTMRRCFFMKFEDYDERPRLTNQLSFFCSEGFRERLVEVSKERGSSISSTIRRLVIEGLTKKNERSGC